MNKQPEALRLADHLQEYWDNYDEEYHAAAELRRLHQVNQELVEALEMLVSFADESDGCQYGTLSTSLVRQIAQAALAKHKEQE